MVAMFRSKKILLIVIIFMVCLISGGTFFALNSKKSNNNSSAPLPAEPKPSEDLSKPIPSLDMLTPPEAKPPELCNELAEAVEKVVGSEFKTNGNKAETNDKSKLTDCNYYKNNQIVNIKVYEYSSQNEAESNLKKHQIKGYSTQSKSEQIVSVSVISEVTPDNQASNKILNMALDKL